MRPNIERLESRHLLSTLPIIETQHEQIPAFGTGGTEIVVPVCPSANNTAWEGTSRTVDYIIPAGVTVTVDDMTDAAREIQVHGTLRFEPTRGTRLLAETILVMPGGTLEMKPNPGVTSEIVIADAPIDLMRDPKQHGHGIVVLGTIDIEGEDKTDWLRVAAEIPAGATTIELESPPVGWKAGDEIILPDTRQVNSADQSGFLLSLSGRYYIDDTLVNQDEKFVIASVSGSTVMLATPTQFAHGGARDADGMLRYLPHVGNLTRSVTIRSENPAGVRGHFMSTGEAQTSIINAAFDEMGRTTAAILSAENQVGRYPVHLHHLELTAAPLANGEQWHIAGIAIDTSPRWGLAIHNSHFGRLEDSVVYNAVGSGIVTEDGSETGNEILRNFVVRSDGSGDLLEARNSAFSDAAHEGAGFWLRGVERTVFDGNVAANAQFAGFVTFQFPSHSRQVSLPVEQGSTQRRTKLIGENSPASFSENEAYGALQVGFDIWNMIAPFAMEDSVVWNASRTALLSHYDNTPNDVHGFVALFDPAKSQNNSGIAGSGSWNGTDIEISGATTGISLVIDSSRLVGLEMNNDTDILVTNQFVRTPRTVEILDAELNGNVGLDMLWTPSVHFSVPSYFTSEIVTLQLRGGPTYRAYYASQAGSFIVPDGPKGAPRPGMTNDEVFAEIGKSIAGAIVPEDAVTISGHNGLFSEE